MNEEGICCMMTEIQKEDIYREFHGKVYGYINAKINNVHTAEDLTSVVFVKVYEKIDDFDRTKASLSTWIYTITRNALIDYYRTRKTFEEIPETLTCGYSIEEKVCSNEMLESLTAALRTLDERERDIIILRYYSGKTLKEIAAGMGISYAYVKVLQNKAFDKLKKYLADQ